MSKFLLEYITDLDGLRKPRMIKQFLCHIDKISIQLPQGLDKFEEELCRQLNEDRINREHKVADGTVLVIQERRLQVGTLTKLYMYWCL